MEARHIITEFQRVALCNPQIAFTVYNNDALVFSLPEANLRQRIVGVHGRGMAHNLLDVFADTSIVKIEGFVGRPESAKKSNKEQYLFVNGRYFNSAYFRKAIVQAYEKLIAPDTQPSYFLYLSIDPERIDVNVHPSKTEIKFDDEPAVWQIFNAAVREALGRAGAVPMMDFEIDSSIDIPVYKEGEPYKVPHTGANPDFNPFRSGTSVRESAGHYSRTPRTDGWEQLYDSDAFSVSGEKTGEKDRFPGAERVSAGAFDEIDSSVQEFIEGEDTAVQGRLMEYDEGFRGALRLSDRLWATTWGGVLTVVDVRRAQECVLYERYMSMLGNDTAVCQQLLFPERIELSAADLSVWTEVEEELSAMGFEFSAVADSVVGVTGIPPGLPVGCVEGTLREILDRIEAEEPEPGRLRTERIASMLARRSAGGAACADETAAISLLGELAGCTNRNYTPSGLPVMTCITDAELEKRLKRE